MLRFSPSTIAAAAVFLARKMTGKSPTWVRLRIRSLSSVLAQKIFSLR
jgi:hypothetical protein